MSLGLFFAQHVSNASTLIFRSLQLCVGILLWYQHSKHVEQKIMQVTSVGLSLFNYQDDARSNKHKIFQTLCNCIRMYSHNIKNIYQLTFFSCKVESNILSISTNLIDQNNLCISQTCLYTIYMKSYWKSEYLVE